MVMEVSSSSSYYSSSDSDDDFEEAGSANPSAREVARALLAARFPTLPGPEAEADVNPSDEDTDDASPTASEDDSEEDETVLKAGGTAL